MLTAESPEIAGNLLGRPHEFAYPLPYTVDDLRHDMGGYLADGRFWEESSLGLSPWQAMERWYNSPAGHLQNTQVARFAMFHAQLRVPELDAPQNSEEANAARHSMLGFIARHAGSNIHPNGHAAVYYGALRSAIYESKFLCEPMYATDPEDRACNRQQPVHHDSTETLYPGVLIACGGLLGDIPTGKKTDEDKALEKTILTYLLDSQYGDAYTDAQRAKLTRLIRHEVSDMTPSERGHHTLAEAVHDLGHRETASRVYEAAWESHAPSWMVQVAVRMAYDVERHTTPRLLEAKQELPHMRDYIDARARKLDEQVSERWSWRKANGGSITSQTLIRRWDRQKQQKQMRVTAKNGLQTADAGTQESTSKAVA